MVSKTRRARDKIDRADSFIKEHEEKIQDELAKPNPNYRRIKHWEAEIRGAKKSRARHERRLDALRRKR